MYEAEIRFAEEYIRKERKDRILHELTDPKKRYRGLSRFCHDAEKYIDPRTVVKDTELPDGMYTILSPDPSVDGLVLPLQEALEVSSMCLDATILLGEKYAAVTEEAMKGSRIRFVLRGGRK
ncbi:MAG: hypothetical protein IJJ24_08210 [Solobacterium sp.]|nr:hypothetical protein [Solobacterium sp.]MBR0479061.1 hypothetical protein [Solobacterium sp.]